MRYMCVKTMQAVLMAMLLAGGLSVAPAVRAENSEAEEMVSSAVTYVAPQSRLAAWAWTDRNVYQPGQSLTVRWTVRPNDDLYPYVVVAYRQNNQTGVKTYFPGGGETPTDINGNTLDQGLVPTQLSERTKAVLVSSAAVPNELGMHTIAVELRDYTGMRVLKTLYSKFGVVNSVQTLTGEITSDRTLTNDTQWNLSGLVAVKGGATLTIEPGTFIIGQPGSQPPSVLLITQEGRIRAIGTRSRPIVMTSSQPIGQRQRGDWGGLIMLGRAPINVGANSGGNQNQAGTFFIEGLSANPDAQYGGNDPNHDCGVLRYVRVEFAGSILSPNNETNSFTWGGCGRATVAEYLQASYGLDDSFEWFGGTSDAKYLVGGLGADDYVDFQLGYTGRVQFGLFYQSNNARGNRGIEGDNSEFNQGATPHSDPTLYNMTFWGSGAAGFDESNSPGIFLRRGARATINNMVVSNFFSSGVDISDANTQAQATAGNVRMNGILLWNNGRGLNPPAANTVGTQVASGYTAQYAQGNQSGASAANFVAANPQIATPIEFSDPDFAGRFNSPIFRTGWVAPPDDGFFDQSARFVGGIGAVDWTEEWTSFHVEGDVAP